MQSNEFWRKKRKHYNALAELVRRVDVVLGPLILVSYATDLYFICLQLLSAVKYVSTSRARLAYLVCQSVKLYTCLTEVT